MTYIFLKQLMAIFRTDLNWQFQQLFKTQSGSPYDNALAERVNGILKNEFYPKRVYQNHKDASKSIGKIVRIYNQQRPHSSVDFLTPETAHQHSGDIKKRWKKYKKNYRPSESEA